MSRIPFDRDAIMLWPNGARGLLSQAGFKIILTHFAFIFPKPLGFLRFAKWPLCNLPFGAQYLLHARKENHPYDWISPLPANVPRHLSRILDAKTLGSVDIHFLAFSLISSGQSLVYALYVKCWLQTKGMNALVLIFHLQAS
jgi:hypothetical protein